MMRRTALFFASALTAVTLYGSPAPDGACTNCLTLGLSQTPISGIPNPTSNPGTDPASSGHGYLSLTVGGSTAPNLPPATYAAWCATKSGDIIKGGTSQNFSATSTYSISGTQWNEINYLLNHKQGTVLEVQFVIWVLLGTQPVSAIEGAPNALAMYNAAITPAGQAFVPAPGQVIGVYFGLNTLSMQDFLVEVVNPCGAIGDFVWRDLNGNGIQDAGETGLDGVAVQLMDTGGSLLTSTTTNTSGYYQFPGLCLATYLVKIDTTQPALVNYTPAPTLRGTNTALDSNVNGAPVPLTSVAPSDQTIDFGFTPGVPMSAACPAPPIATQNVPYSSQIPVSGGTSPFTYTITPGSLPPGLTLSAGGLISGTPDVTGPYSFGVSVMDVNGQVATGSGCSINVVPPPSLTCSAVNTGEVGVAFNAPAITVTGGTGKGTYTFSVATGTLPAGLTLNASTGEITGTPTSAGSFTIQVKDANGVVAAGTCPFTILAPPSLTCSAVNTGEVGVAFNAPAITVTGGTGKGTYTFSVATGALPAGLTLNASTGAITGTPTSAGSFTIQVKDANGVVAVGTCPFTILPGIPVGTFFTYTQGGWGAPPNGNNPGALLAKYFATVYPGGSVKIGGTYRLTFTSALAIENFLPQGGTPGEIKASATNPTISLAGVLAGQLLALQLSVDFSNKGILPGGLALLHVASGPMQGLTVAQVLTIANAVMGGNLSALPAGMSISGLVTVLDSINNNFDGGTTNLGYLK